MESTTPESPRKRGKGLRILHGRATLYPPSAGKTSYRVAYTHPITGKRTTTTVGPDLEQAKIRAAALLGDATPGKASREIEPPTLKEVADSWLTTNAHRWSPRTREHYYYLTKKATDSLGERYISSITPRELTLIPTESLSRGQQERLRTVIRGIFTHGKEWLHREPESYATAIKITGSKAAARSPQVQAGDIPTGRYVATLIHLSYSTAQLTPLDDPATTELNPLTGEKAITGFHLTGAPGTHALSPLDPLIRAGMPLETHSRQRRGVPRHYTNHRERMERETREIASRYRQAGLIFTLGAGAGLRIGEALALRVRHILTPAQAATYIQLKAPWGEPTRLLDATITPWSGEIHVQEQASQGSRGKIYLTRPKGNRARTVHAPAFLPHWDGEPRHQRQRAGIATHVPRLTTGSLHRATTRESHLLWRAGYIPLSHLLRARLLELWEWLTTTHGATMDYPALERAYQDLLLFPTRNPARKGRDGAPRAIHEPTWSHRAAIVEGAGTYQSQANLARLTGPIYTRATELTGEIPASRTNTTGRQSFTHHSLRHWNISSRLHATQGASLPTIAAEAGHSDGAFTLQRYGHLISHSPGEDGWEF